MHVLKCFAAPRRLASALAAAFALAGFVPLGQAANTLPVSSCADDGGSTTLRSVIAAAASGDTVSMQTLTCTITLDDTRGAIPVAKGVTIEGSGYATLQVIGNDSQIFVGSTTDQVSFKNMSMSNGTISGTGLIRGGCVQMAGSVYMRDVVLHHCSAESTDGDAFGGAIYTPAAAVLFNSSVAQSHVSGYSQSLGGGICAGSLDVTYSTITQNDAYSATIARGGGAFSIGGVFSNSSTFANNTADYGGGIAQYSYSQATSGPIEFVESTISGNTARGLAGGFYSYCYHCTTPDIGIFNSTIAFNNAPRVGVGFWAASNVVSHSSIFSNNGSNDVYLRGHSFSGTNNLVISSNVVPASGSVTVTADPQLTFLAAHGAAPTIRARTLGLSVNSPAIGKGDNLLNFVFDERGDFNGPFSRSNPATGSVDVGAFQRQPNDEELFTAGLSSRFTIDPDNLDVMQAILENQARPYYEYRMAA